MGAMGFVAYPFYFPEILHCVGEYLSKVDLGDEASRVNVYGLSSFIMLTARASEPRIRDAVVANKELLLRIGVSARDLEHVVASGIPQESPIVASAA